MNIFVSICTKVYFVNVFNGNYFGKVCEEVYVLEIVNLVTVAFHRLRHRYWGLFLALFLMVNFVRNFEVRITWKYCKAKKER